MTAHRAQIRKLELEAINNPNADPRIRAAIIAALATADAFCKSMRINPLHLRQSITI